MENGHGVFCILCKRSEETKVTGPLSSKENVTAHQNCLLYSSGIWSEDSPQENDLFGFSVADVTQEVKRGKKLKCHKCKKGGATCGCEFKLCRKSYHYPCAVEDRALSFEKTEEGEYGIYCPDHRGLHNDDGSANRRTSSTKNVAAPKKTCGAGAVKGNCLTCENKEGKVPLDSLSSDRIMSYCEKHAPSSYKDTNGESSGVGMSESSSDANSTKSVVSKRPMSSDEDEDVSPVRNKSKRRLGEHPLNSAHEFITNTGTLLFPPIDDDDFSESAQDSTPHRGDGESPAGSSSKQGSRNQPDESRGGEKDGEDDDTMDPGDESQSLLAPVHICLSSFTPSEFSPPTESVQEKAEERPERESSPEQSPAHSPQEQTTAPSVPPHSSTPPSPHASKPSSVTDSPPRPSSASPAPPEPISISLLSSSPSPETPPPNQDPDPDPEPAIDSASFWKNCNTAGCTQAMFSDFMKEMNEISERIQSEQASQTDYDLALKVMSSSGQLEKLVTKQQQELQKKQRELEKAVAAMSEVVSALQR